ncbi:MAG: hypothetical protein OHK93_006754 [Ramalina farinacea]|uniref:Uncharacterized protein n=1 Tax=Ramalina farinacea TaxID=258253 RepID=A0AA43TTT5_9LECA|nr:hypothetical protein [Ramalina farinacea]
MKTLRPPSSLDGWEETDDPIDEHLSHCGHCGWAIAVATDRAIERGDDDLKDPSSEEMLDARKMTFAGWPHEDKRGWLCKTQKMIEAGWHYCPNPESDDFARCSYCSLSLDGWEPKDNPFQEHQRRSPDCIFFKTRVENKPKASKGRRGRASRASRMSTQSNATLASEAPSFVESELNGDESSLSAVPMPKPKTTKGGGKGGSKKSKKSKASQKPVEEPPHESSYREPEDDDFSVKIDHSPEAEQRGRKRKSEDVGQADEAKGETEAASEAPPTKRRATRTRSSVLFHQSALEVIQPPDDEDVDMTDAEKEGASSAPVSKKGRQGGKKRASSSTRKASKMSTASQASLRSAIPRDEDIDAALALDLDRPLTDDEEIDVEGDVKPKTRRLTRTKPGSKKSTASRAPTRKANRASSAQSDESVIIVDDVTLPKQFNEAHNDDQAPIEENASPEDELSTEKAAKKPPPRKRGPKQKVFGEENDNEHGLEKEQEPAEEERVQRKSPPPRKQTRQVSRQLPARGTRMSAIPTNQAAETQRLDSSMLDSPTLGDDSGHETDTSVVIQSHEIQKGLAKGAAKKGTKGKKAKPANENNEESVQPPNDPADDRAAVVDEMPEVPALEEKKQPEGPEKPKGKKSSKAKAAPKTGKAKKGAPKSKAPVKEVEEVEEASLVPPKPSSSPHVREASPERPAEPLSAPAVADLPTSPPAQTAHSTPAASPQSSDAENHPPSSRPSEVRPSLAVQSPTKSQMTRIPLAVSTPTRSPVKNTFSRLQTSVPWTMTDLEQIFQGTPGQEKENNPFNLGIDEVKGGLTSPEKKMTVEQWIQFNASRGEEKFRSDCERMVGKFEAEGMRAMKTLEGIECAE